MAINEKTTTNMVISQKFADFLKKNIKMLASFRYISYFCHRFI
jgi:hypothetical protein